MEKELPIFQQQEPDLEEDTRLVIEEIICKVEIEQSKGVN